MIVLRCDGRIQLNSGGYRTTTTKRRMNQCLLGHRVYQRDFAWYVSAPDGTVRPFEDGMLLS